MIATNAKIAIIEKSRPHQVHGLFSRFRFSPGIGGLALPVLPNFGNFGTYGNFGQLPNYQITHLPQRPYFLSKLSDKQSI